MIKKFYYSHIRILKEYGYYTADYFDGVHYFALHVCLCRTKKRALEIARAQVDYLNDKLKKGETI